MSFKTKKIRHRKRRPSIFTKITHYATKPYVISTLGIVLVIFFIGYGFLRFFPQLNLVKIFSGFAGIFGKSLATDQFNQTNILLLGTGSKGHEGEHLTDSIVLVNINHDTNSVNLVSLPRDLYMSTSEYRGNRINHMYEIALLGTENEENFTEALDFMRRNVSDVLNIEIPYAIKIDFRGFERAVDLLGGIDLYVNKTIDDPFYPEEGTYGYQRFFIAEGNQHLDGKTALKYVRSRKTSSDFDRSKRQQQVLIAIRDKAVEENILSRPSKVKALYRAIAEHVVTNLDIRELLSLSGLAAKFDTEKLYKWSLHDDPSRAGYFLYTPVRSLYGGAYVLLPAGDSWEHISRFFRIIFNGAHIIDEGQTIQVLNGAGTPYMAGITKDILQRNGFDVSRFGNAETNTVETTTIYYKTADEPELAELVRLIIPAEVSSKVPEVYLQQPYASDATLIIVLGADFVDEFHKLDIFRNIFDIDTSGDDAEAAAEAEDSAE
jgi:polyisoprenyl-teichoic acid--peptidoglycan teichoic acid transferase